MTSWAFLIILKYLFFSVAKYFFLYIKKINIYIIYLLKLYQNTYHRNGAVRVVIVWYLDLQLPIQSVPITWLKLWVRIPLRWGVLDTTLCDRICQWLSTGRWFSPGTMFSSTNKTDRHDITEIHFLYCWKWC